MSRGRLHDLLARRILLLDGAIGTMLQRHGLGEQECRGDRFRAHPHDLAGNHDLLVLTNPAIVSDIHDAYLNAGADIIETNTFRSTAIDQAGYGLEPLAYELNVAGARLARAAADRWSLRTPDRPRFVAGAIGPTARRLSASDVSAGSVRVVTFDAVRDAYRDQVRGLIDGGVDLLLLETIVDARNAQAAIAAVGDELDARGADVPLMISATVTDDSGRLLSGHTLAAFHDTIRHARPFSIGLNCGRGARHIGPFLAELARDIDSYTTCHPSAGLPGQVGNAKREGRSEPEAGNRADPNGGTSPTYDERPREFADLLHALAESGLVNILGGCCGTTPAHIRALADAVERLAPRTARRT